MKIRNSIAGFSLMEIMITVAIVGIMASSVAVGFGSFGETIRVQETAGVVQDIIKEVELQALRREFQSATIYFEQDYLVVVEEIENADASLTWNGTSMDVKDLYDPDPIYLAQRDEYGNNIEIQSFDADASIDVDNDVTPGFIDSEDLEWQYQAFTDTSASNIIRFIHFNVRRENLADPITLSPTTYSLKIEAPYVKKTFYSGDTVTPDEVMLTFSATDTDPYEITLQD